MGVLEELSQPNADALAPLSNVESVQPSSTSACSTDVQHSKLEAQPVLCIDFKMQTPFIILPRSRGNPTHLRIEASSIAIRSSAIPAHERLECASLITVEFHDIGLSTQDADGITHELLQGLGLTIKLESGLNQEDAVVESSTLLEAPGLAMEVALQPY